MSNQQPSTSTIQHRTFKVIFTTFVFLPLKKKFRYLNFGEKICESIFFKVQQLTS